jgi:hypothetical protein
MKRSPSFAKDSPSTRTALHASVHFLLGQSLARAGRADEAREELAQHQVGRESEGPSVTVATFERSRYTQPRVPFRLEQPDPTGVPVRFVDTTASAFGNLADRCAGPAGVLDPAKSGASGLFVLERGTGFRFLRNERGVFSAQGPTFPSRVGPDLRAILVGDLQNDRFEDVVVLGDRGTQVFQFGTNQAVSEVTLEGVAPMPGAIDGALVDLDFTGKLDLVAIGSSPAAVRVFRQTSPLRFVEITEASGLADPIREAREVHVDDWNGDGLPDLAITHATGIPQRFEKVRGGKLVARPTTNWVGGSIACAGDFDNDLRPDLATLHDDKLVLCLASGARQEVPIPKAGQVREVVAIDHDNDGWLDLWIVGDRLRAWRNGGLSGFAECTAALGLELLQLGSIASVHAADFRQRLRYRPGVVPEGRWAPPPAQ